MYILVGTPSTPNECYDTLNEVFGGNSFEASDAQDALMKVHDMSSEEAMNELSTLLRLGVIGQA